MWLEGEKEGCADFLQSLSDDDVHSLFITVTDGNVDETMRQGKEKAILAFSVCADSFFRRKRLTKDVLVNYAYRRGLTVTRGMGKRDVQLTILSYWRKRGVADSSQVKQEKHQPVSPTSTDHTSNSPTPTPFVSSPHTQPYTPHTQPPSPTPFVSSPHTQPYTPNTQPPTPSSCPLTPSPTLTSTMAGSPHTLPTSPLPTPSFLGALTPYIPSPHTPFYEPPHDAPHPLSVSVIINNYYINSGPSQEDKDREMASAFLHWFYKMLNSLHPSCSQPDNEFGRQHFWENAELHIHMISDNGNQTVHASGNVDVATKLASIPLGEGLLFNANVNRDGVLVRSDPHGLKLILACGTLLRDNNCVGVFQQSFGLVRGPHVQDSWKIKVTFLKMTAGSVHSQPSLDSVADSQYIEGLTIKALENSVAT